MSTLIEENSASSVSSHDDDNDNTTFVGFDRSKLNNIESDSDSSSSDTEAEISPEVVKKKDKKKSPPATPTKPYSVNLGLKKSSKKIDDDKEILKLSEKPEPSVPPPPPPSQPKASVPAPKEYKLVVRSEEDKEYNHLRAVYVKLNSDLKIPAKDEETGNEVDHVCLIVKELQQDLCPSRNSTKTLTCMSGRTIHVKYRGTNCNAIPLAAIPSLKVTETHDRFLLGKLIELSKDESSLTLEEVDEEKEVKTRVQRSSRAKPVDPVKRKTADTSSGPTQKIPAKAVLRMGKAMLDELVENYDELEDKKISRVWQAFGDLVYGD